MVLLGSAGSAGGNRSSTGFLLAYAFAYTGGVVAYLPLLTLLLPMKIERVANAARLELLSVVAIAGAIAASLANIGFGWLSDRSATRPARRRLVALIGLAALAASYVGVILADTPVLIVGAAVAFQTAVNAVLAPLAAIMAEEIPDAQKGTASGLLALGHPAAAAVSAVLVSSGDLSDSWRIGVLPAIVAACILPFLLCWPATPVREPEARFGGSRLRHDLIVAWVARLLVQTASVVMSLYLFYFAQRLAPGVEHAALARQIGQIMFVAAAAALPVAVMLGGVSDRTGRRKPFLIGTAGLAAAALMGMTRTQHLPTAGLCLVVYVVSVAGFLAVHAACTMQLLPNPDHRGRDLGFVNLTNTLPALLGPALVWALATPSDYLLLLLMLAALTTGGGLLILGVTTTR